jgi:DNA-directed RNA polymerase specialized sigma24 family protein
MKRKDELVGTEAPGPQPEKPVETGEDTRSILDTLDALPPAHARKLLQREIDRASGELARYTERMETLK